MTRYDLLVFLHLVAVIVWLGAGFLLAVLVFGAEREGDRLRESGYHRDVAWLAPRLFIPASLATLLLGILLVIDGPWSFDQLWIMVGLVGWAVSFVLGFFYFRPEGERIGALVAQHGPTYPEVETRLRRLNVVDRLQVLILFVVVADMVIRPTGDDTGVLIVGAAVLAVAGTFGLVAIRAGRAPGEPPGSAGEDAPAMPAAGP